MSKYSDKCRDRIKRICPRFGADLCGATPAEVAEHAEKKAEKEKKHV